MNLLHRAVMGSDWATTWLMPVLSDACSEPALCLTLKPQTAAIYHVMNMLTQLCAVALIVHARDSGENTTFASVAVIFQHKYRRNIDTPKVAHLVADNIRKTHSRTSKHVVNLAKSLMRLELVCDWKWAKSFRWDCRSLKSKKLNINMYKPLCWSNYENILATGNRNLL